jgi:hypothetical protein
MKHLVNNSNFIISIINYNYSTSLTNIKNKKTLIVIEVYAKEKSYINYKNIAVCKVYN